MIEITDEAYTRLLKKAKEANRYCFRVGLRGGGCGGFEYIFDYCNNTSPDDIELDVGEITIKIDKISAPYIHGLTLDYIIEGLNEEFTFLNPNQIYACGCGKSVGF